MADDVLAEAGEGEGDDMGEHGMGDGIMMMGEAEGMLGDGDGDGDGEIALEDESTIQLGEMLAAAAAAADADVEDSGRAYGDDDGHMARNGSVRINTEDGDGVAGHQLHPLQQHQFADIDGDDMRGDGKQE